MGSAHLEVMQELLVLSTQAVMGTDYLKSHCTV